GKKADMKVVGLLDAAMNPLYLAEVTVSNPTFGKYFHADGDRFAFIKGGSLPDLKSAMAAYPAAKVTTTDKFVDDQLSWMSAMPVQALHGEGLTFQLPVGTLIAFVVISVVAGTLAAIAPARRAARLDVLEALQYV